MNVVPPAGSLPAQRPMTPAWRPEGCDIIALALQGGGALGAYQAGVYQALHEAGVEPDSIAGLSIGAINGAIIAGNPREQRLARLRDFWEGVTAHLIWPFAPDDDNIRKVINTWSSWLTASLGQPGFFKPHSLSPWLSPMGSETATSLYDTSPLRETLLRLVDFDRLNSGAMRYATGAVNVLNGNFTYFDNTRTEIVPEHIMASGALPPAFPMVRIGTEHYWDGGLVSNTPLLHVLETEECQNMLVFQVDLFSASGELPRDLHDVLARRKDILYSSRTRLITDNFHERRSREKLLAKLLAKLPEDQLDEAERALKTRLARVPDVTILQLIYREKAYKTQAADYEFSSISIRDHWDCGYRDAEQTLRRRDWLKLPPNETGVVVHDVHQADD